MNNVNTTGKVKKSIVYTNNIIIINYNKNDNYIRKKATAGKKEKQKSN